MTWDRRYSQGCTIHGPLGRAEFYSLQRNGSMVLSTGSEPGYNFHPCPFSDPPPIFHLPRSHLSSQPGRWRGRERIGMRMKNEFQQGRMQHTSYSRTSCYCTPEKVKQAAKCSAFSERSWEFKSHRKIKIHRKKTAIIGNNYTIIHKIIHYYGQYVIIQYYSHWSSGTQ